MLTYTTYVTALSTLTAIDSNNADFQTILPSVIDYGEDRIYRELDMLVEQVRDTGTLVSGSRNFNLPTNVGTFIIIDGLNVITPAATQPDSGTRIPLTPVSRDFLDLTWPSSGGATVPQYFCYLSQSRTAAQVQVLVGPWPDNNYVVEVIGTQQPAALSVSNPTTFLTANLPDLFLAASMIFMSGYLKNFGSQADDARQAQSWEGQYQLLKQSAATFEARKRFSGASWTSKQAEPTAVAQRG